jgi:hypothetical protein
MKIYDSFNEYVKLFVIPRKNENPDQLRLDGQESGGNREIAGVFQHQNKVWKVHGDTRYEPILLAYDVMRKEMEDPFIEKTTNSGKGSSLILKDEIQQLSSKPRFKHLYIYEYNPK